MPIPAGSSGCVCGWRCPRMSDGRARRALRFALPWLGLGALGSAGLAPFHAPWLALPALAVALHLFLKVAGPRQGFAAGWCLGTGYFALSMAWLVNPFFVDPWRHGWMAPFALTFMAGGLALFWGAALFLAARARRPGLRLALAVVALTAAELLRGYIFTGFPWGMIGQGWIGWPVMQLAAWGGDGLLTLAMLVPVALAARLKPAGVGAGLALVAGLWGLGAWRAAQPLPPDRPETLRIVQPDIAQSLKWDRASAEENLRHLVTLSAAQPVPDLVLWPETALPYLYDGPSLLTVDIAEAIGRPLLIGAIRIDGMRAYNSLLEIAADGTVDAIYDKHHLVPFGEYIPFEGILSHIGLQAFTAQQGGGYSSGPGPQVMEIDGFGKVLPLICYEAVFPQDLRGTARPDWLYQATNDAWFGTFSGPYQHLAQAQLRAVEQGLPLLRAANTGVSAVIDAHGEIRNSLPLGQSGVIDTALPGALPPTFYARTGDGPLAMLLLVLLALLGLRAVRDCD